MAKPKKRSGSKTSEKPVHEMPEAKVEDLSSKLPSLSPSTIRLEEDASNAVVPSAPEELPMPEETPMQVPSPPVFYEEPILTQLIVEKYEGETVNGLYEGEGVAYFDGGNVYKGMFSEGIMHGRGTYSWCDGVTYEGDFYMNVPMGHGTYTWPDGSTYQGEVKNGIRHGFGMYRCATQPISYNGEWNWGKRHGKGTLYYSNDGSSWYEGNWVNNTKCGWGVRCYSSGNIYEGQWVNNIRHGEGKMRWLTSNEEYTGMWVQGIQNGYGTHTWFLKRVPGSQYPLRNEYVGDFVNGARHGRGKFLYASGAIYDGKWSNNKKHGLGKFIFKNGRIYEGEFENDLIAEFPNFRMDRANTPDLSGIRTQSPIDFELEALLDPLQMHPWSEENELRFEVESKVSLQSMLASDALKQQLSSRRRQRKELEAILDPLQMYLLSEESELRFEVTPKVSLQSRLASDALEQQLSSRRKELSSRREELSSRREELSSRREELSSRREELSSRNEELSSRREELSSRREKLSSRREELSSRREELSSRREELSSRRKEKTEKIISTFSSFDFGSILGANIDLDISSLLEVFPEDERPHELKQVEYAVLRHITELRKIYNVYSSLGHDISLDNTFLMTRLQFWRLLLDCKLHHYNLTLSDMDRILNENKPPDMLHSPHDTLLLRNFLSYLIHLSFHLHKDENQERDSSLDLAFSKIMSQNITPNACQIKGNLFSDPECTVHLANYINKCWDIYQSSCTKRSLPPFEKVMKMRHFIYILKEFNIINKELTAAKVVDILTADNPSAHDGVDTNLELEITFIEFFEALLSCAAIYVTNDMMDEATMCSLHDVRAADKHLPFPGATDSGLLLNESFHEEHIFFQAYPEDFSYETSDASYVTTTSKMESIPDKAIKLEAISVEQVTDGKHPKSLLKSADARRKDSAHRLSMTNLDLILDPLQMYSMSEETELSYDVERKVSIQFMLPSDTEQQLTIDREGKTDTVKPEDKLAFWLSQLYIFFTKTFFPAYEQEAHVKEEIPKSRARLAEVERLLAIQDEEDAKVRALKKAEEEELRRAIEESERAAAAVDAEQALKDTTEESSLVSTPPKEDQTPPPVQAPASKQAGGGRRKKK